VIFVDADIRGSYNFAQVRDTTLTFANGIKSIWKWKKGDVLAVFSPNSNDIPAIIYSVAWAGGVVSPANPTYTVEELAFQLKDSDAKALVTQVPLLPVAWEAAKKVGLPDDRIIVMGDLCDPDMRVKHFTSIRNMSGTARFRKEKVDPKKDVAYLVYSSGTTGLPK
jgi:4-coumarate--CoA ligase